MANPDTIIKGQDMQMTFSSFSGSTASGELTLHTDFEGASVKFVVGAALAVVRKAKVITITVPQAGSTPEAIKTALESEENQLATEHFFFRITTSGQTIIDAAETFDLDIETESLLFGMKNATITPDGTASDITSVDNGGVMTFANETGVRSLSLSSSELVLDSNEMQMRLQMTKYYLRDIKGKFERGMASASTLGYKARWALTEFTVSSTYDTHFSGSITLASNGPINFTHTTN